MESSELIRENNEEVDRSAAARTGRQRLNRSDILYNNDSNCNAPAPVNLDSITPSAFEEEDGISVPFQLGHCQSILRNIPSSDSQDSDSVDTSDKAFSQNSCLSSFSHYTSEDSEDFSDGEKIISDQEIRSLRHSQNMTSYCAGGGESGAPLWEDLHSRIFHDFNGERFSAGPWEEVHVEEERCLRSAMSLDDLQAKENAQRHGGLPMWHYESPFAEVTVRVDDVNDTLEHRFLEEAHDVLRKVKADIVGCGDLGDDSAKERDVVTPLSCLQSFVSDCLLEKLSYGANRVLHQNRQKGTSKEELLGLIIIHVLCAAYDESPSTICDASQGDFFFQMGIEAERYHQVWAALSGAKDRRGT